MMRFETISVACLHKPTLAITTQHIFREFDYIHWFHWWSWPETRGNWEKTCGQLPLTMHIVQALIMLLRINLCLHSSISCCVASSKNEFSSLMQNSNFSSTDLVEKPVKISTNPNPYDNNDVHIGPLKNYAGKFIVLFRLLPINPCNSMYIPCNNFYITSNKHLHHALLDHSSKILAAATEYPLTKIRNYVHHVCFTAAMGEIPDLTDVTCPRWLIPKLVVLLIPVCHDLHTPIRGLLLKSW